MKTDNQLNFALCMQRQNGNVDFFFRLLVLSRLLFRIKSEFVMTVMIFERKCLRFFFL